MRFAGTLADLVERRASSKLLGAAIGTDYGIISYPLKGKDDWALIQMTSERENAPKLPVAFHVLEVDRLIDETLAKLRAIVDGEPLPNFEVFEGEQANETEGAE
ncbi:MAG: hypothetical protein U1E25_10810 [Methylocystis sp.]